MKVTKLQFLAMLTMLIDHIGLIWFPENLAWRVIGRLALPFYAFTMVLGYFRTSDIHRYLKRTAGIAILSQLPYQFAFQRLEVNTVGSLFVCLLLLHLLDKWNGKPILQVLLAAGFAGALEVLPFSYGAYVVMLVLIYRYAQTQWFTLFHFSVNVVSFFIKGWFIQIFSLFATLLLVYWPDFMRGADKIKVPRLVWRSFYPLHLAIIAIVYYVTSNQSFKEIIRAL
ncbi:TraX family protein [Paenibacillus sp. LHD-38]|uniref:TraX family protein n=1 Tax=Paenibacillus sp. LHD-38 TaxID=3072143 RepID=UPI00280D6B50|nr:TraX family protein [Paenibacillus sp. LHD-38]MDQ8736137.1 TraX family protein [Paenibacillus sp. LHD-38]